MLCVLEESAAFVQHEQELVASAENVTLGLPGKIYTSAVRNGGRKQKVSKTFHSARVHIQQGLEPRTTVALLEGAAELTTAWRGMLRIAA